jgi:hypothetical protein
MINKLIKYIYILNSLNISICFCSQLKGKVIDYDSNNAISGADIFIQGTNKGCSSDNEGHYVINDLPIGKNILIIRSFGYIRINDTISVVNNDINIIINYKLQFSCIDYKIHQLPKYIKYHKDLKANLKNNNIISFSVDSLVLEQNGLYFYSTFINNTSLPVYILRENECIKPFEFIITNSKGDQIKSNCISLSCDTKLFFNPDSNDLIFIPPLSKYHYPKTICWLYDFSFYPNDQYIITIFYEKRNPLKLRLGRLIDNNYEIKYKSEIYAAQIALRGKYKADKPVIFVKN